MIFEFDVLGLNHISNEKMEGIAQSFIDKDVRSYFSGLKKLIYEVLDHRSSKFVVIRHLFRGWVGILDDAVYGRCN